MSIPTPADVASQIHNTSDQTAAFSQDLTSPHNALDADFEFSPALLFAEDFVLTALLSAGKPLRTLDLGSRATDWVLPKRALSQALQNARTLSENDRIWDARWRVQAKNRSREERLRQPIETTLRELLLVVGKPLPTPVLARELDLIRQVPDPNVKTVVSQVLKTARWALEVAPEVWLHQDFVFKTGAPSEELLIKENELENDPDFQGLMQFADITATDAAAIARELMEFTGGPLNQKVIGFFVNRAAPTDFSPARLASVLNDRTMFQPLLGGFVALQNQITALKELTREFLEAFEAPFAPTDLAALLDDAQAAQLQIQNSAQNAEPRAQNSATPAQAVDEVEIKELKRLARASQEAFHVAQGVLQLHDYASDDPRLLEAIARARAVLEADKDWISAGGGYFYLREMLPEGIGAPHSLLVPVKSEIENPATGAPFDFELPDAALDAHSVAFIHDPQWEDVGEESEAAAPQTRADFLKIVVLNHHRRAGTIRLRRFDEPFFDFVGPFAPFQIVDPSEDETYEVWASRETGLLNGLAQWCEEHLPPSGGTVCFSRTGEQLQLRFEPPHAATFLTERRIDELGFLREREARFALFHILVELFRSAKSGLEIETLWAGCNAVRRTSKRLMCSVLNGYACFAPAAKGQKIVWQLQDEGDSATLKQELAKIAF